MFVLLVNLEFGIGTGLLFGFLLGISMAGQHSRYRRQKRLPAWEDYLARRGLPDSEEEISKSNTIVLYLHCLLGLVATLWLLYDFLLSAITANQLLFQMHPRL